MWDVLTENWKLLLPLATGALGMLALLPQPRRLPTPIGVGLIVLTLILAVYGIGSVSTFEQGMFYGFSFIAIVSGMSLVTHTQPTRAALSFTLVVLSTAGLFLLLAAPFLFAASIIVYAGAIIVIFLFVLMLAQQTGRDDADLRSREPLLSVVTGFVLLGTLFYLIQKDTVTNPRVDEPSPVAELQRLTNLAQRASDAPDAVRQVLLDSAIKEDENGDRQTLPTLFREQLRNVILSQPRLLALQGTFQARLENDVLRDWGQLPQDPTQGSSERKRLLGKLVAIGNEALAILPMRANPKFSTFSGPVGVPSTELRRTADGLPAMPAQNSTYLGKSLFTDFLLPVELGGILLMVAVIGAILIAQRQDEQGKEIA